MLSTTMEGELPDTKHRVSHVLSNNFTIVQDELEEEILFQGLWGQIQVVIGMLQSSLAQSQVQFS